jgi:hypothetical protein
MTAELMFGNPSRFDCRMLTVWLGIAMDLFIARLSLLKIISARSNDALTGLAQ